MEAVSPRLLSLVLWLLVGFWQNIILKWLVSEGDPPPPHHRSISLVSSHHTPSWCLSSFPTLKDSAARIGNTARLRKMTADEMTSQLKEMGVSATRKHASVGNKAEWEAELQQLSPPPPPFQLSKTLVFKPSM